MSPTGLQEDRPLGWERVLSGALVGKWIRRGAARTGSSEPQGQQLLADFPLTFYQHYSCAWLLVCYLVLVLG